MVVSMERWVGKIAIVTGASSGIGAAIVERLVEEGLIVVGLARRIELIQDHKNRLQGKKGKLYPIKADLTKEEDVLNAFSWVTENLGNIHILINNAGTGTNGGLTDGETKTWKTIFDLNVLGLCISTREAIKNMKNNNIKGHIIHINSTSGHSVATHVLNVYPASKHAVTALTETLRQELNHLSLKIKVTSVSPGLVATELTTLNPHLSPEVKKLLETRVALKVEDVVDAVVYALSTPEHVQVHELTIRPF